MFTRRSISATLAFVLALLAVFTLAAPLAQALPTGFTDVPVMSVPYDVLAARFAPDGTLFFAQKTGSIRVADSVEDLSITEFVDISGEVQSDIDQGLLGLAIHPDFPTTPYVYALYTIPNGATRSGQLTRWTYDPLTQQPVANSRVDLLSGGWCFTASSVPYASHSVGDLHFGPDGALYISAGEGANFDKTDIGNEPEDFCPDPVNEGGALRSQDIETSSDPANLNGAILRVDPLTGDALPDNPFFGDADENKARIIAYGLRNPYRFAVDQNDGALYIGDNGWALYEEINAIPNPTDAVVENFGWPCYEGDNKQPGYDAEDVAICENLYTSGTATLPLLTIPHAPPESMYSSTGAAVYDGETFPSRYDGALFFGDFAGATAIRAMLRDQEGNLNATATESFLIDAGANPVDIQVGPDGALYYVSYNANILRRIQYGGPLAAFTATPEAGLAPLNVTLDASSSTSQVPGALTYEWDLDNDGAFDDATSVTVEIAFDEIGLYPIRLKITDAEGGTDTTSSTITVGEPGTNLPPTVSLIEPSTALLWSVGSTVPFEAVAYDPEGFLLPPSAFSWTFLISHCQVDNATDCHQHSMDLQNGVTQGTVIAPTHEYPSLITIALTVTELPWWNDAWDRRTSVTINTDGLSETLTNVPILVTLTPETFAYEHTLGDGLDLRFVNRLGQELPYEIEEWNPAGTSTLWVLADEIDPALDVNGFWLYYDNPAAGFGQQRAAVWANDFAAVYHLALYGSAVIDSVEVTDGVLLGGPTPTQGVIGPAIAFDGVDDYINTQFTNSLHNTDWSISLWAKLDPSLVCTDGPEGDVEGINLFVKDWDYRVYLKQSCKYGFITRRANDDPNNAVWQPIIGGNGADTQIFELGTPEDRAWHYVVYQYNQSANTVEAYVDGVLAGTNVTQTSQLEQFASFDIGGGGGSQKSFPGLIDDVTIATTTRSADWIALAHRAGLGTQTALGAEQVRVLLGEPLETLVQRNVYPETVNVTLQTAPTGLALSIFGRTVISEYVQEMILGSSASLIAPSNQTVGNLVYGYVNWSDGGSRSRTITATSANQSYLANYEVTAVLDPATPGVGPVQSNLAVSKIASSVATLTISTNEVATCRYGSVGSNFANKTLFAATAALEHEVEITGLSASTSYTYGVLCQDVDGNDAFAESTITFATSAAPSSSSGGGGGGGRRSSGGGGGGSSSTAAALLAQQNQNNANNANSVSDNADADADVCESEWSCSEWTACIDGEQGRVCEDINDCAQPTDLPDATQACQAVTPEQNAAPTDVAVVEDAQVSALTGFATAVTQAAGSPWSWAAFALVIAIIVAVVVVLRRRT